MADSGDTRSESRRRFALGKGKRRGGGSKLARSETVTVRLDPKLRYLAELASRKQRRTLSSFIEWAIEETLKTIHFQESRDEFSVSAASVAAELWDVDEPDRFAKLALRYPDMLTHEEQILWKLVRENGSLWKGHYDNTGTWEWSVEPDSLLFERLREHWATFNAVARGDSDVSALPSWKKKKRPVFGDDEIPF